MRDRPADNPGCWRTRSCQTATSLAAAALLHLGASASISAQPQPANIPDGTWVVHGVGIPGMRCGDWLVRLTNNQGRLSGVVSLNQGSAPLQNLFLYPDGRFSGATQPGVVGARYSRIYEVVGTFSGDTVRLTLESELCPPRRGTARRSG